MDEVGQAGNDASASAEMSASIMPAYRAGVERSGVERVGVPSDAAVPVPTHAELLESLRVARGGATFRSGSSAENTDGYSPRDGRMASRSDGYHAEMHEPDPHERRGPGGYLPDHPSYAPAPIGGSAPTGPVGGLGSAGGYPGGGVGPGGGYQSGGAGPVGAPVPVAALEEDTREQPLVVPQPRRAVYEQSPVYRSVAATPSGDYADVIDGELAEAPMLPDEAGAIQGGQPLPAPVYQEAETSHRQDADAAEVPARPAVEPQRAAAPPVTGSTFASAAFPATREPAFAESAHRADPAARNTDTGYPVPAARAPGSNGVHGPVAHPIGSFREPIREAAGYRSDPYSERPLEAEPIPLADGVDPLDPSVPVETVEASLPHRIPAPPDVPDVDDEWDDDDIEDDLPADVDGPELTRIASGLRTDARSAIPDDLDVNAVLAAVRHVDGVQDAQLRGAPGEVQTLRLELADGADPGRVSRAVARLLKERMGIAAEPRRHSDITGTRRAEGAEPRRPDTLTRSGAPIRPAGPARGFERPESLTDAPAPQPHPSPPPIFNDGPKRPFARVVLDRVKVATVGTEANVEVRLAASSGTFVGTAAGPSVDGYLLRLAAQAAAGAIDSLMAGSPIRTELGTVRCFIDHAGVVPFGSCLVAVSVVLVSGDGWVEQLVGSALVAGDPRQAIVRATLAAVNRRLENLLG